MAENHAPARTGSRRPRSTVLLAGLTVLLGCSQASNSEQHVQRTQDGPSMLEKRIGAGEYSAVIVLDEDMQPTIYLGDGLDAKNRSCGSIAPDGRIVDNEKLPPEERCNLNGIDLTSLREIQVFGIRQNPKCMVIRMGNQLVKVHRGGDGYPRGAYPCHKKKKHK